MFLCWIRILVGACRNLQSEKHIMDLQFMEQSRGKNHSSCEKQPQLPVLEQQDPFNRSNGINGEGVTICPPPLTFSTQLWTHGEIIVSSRLRKSNVSWIYSLFWLIDWLLLEVKCYSILPTHSRMDLKASGEDQSLKRT